MLPQALQYLDAGHARHHPIENYNVKFLFGGQPQHIRSAHGLHHVQFRTLERGLQQAPETGFVIRNQDLAAHNPPSRTERITMARLRSAAAVLAEKNPCLSSFWESTLVQAKLGTEDLRRNGNL